MPISSADELVTSMAETRAGFIEFALEKNKRSKPYIDSAKALRHAMSAVSNLGDLLHMAEIRDPLVTASGVSDKAYKYFSDEAKVEAIGGLIRNFLEPAGTEFREEVVYRYLLMKGDALGGSMRNIVGALAQQKLVRHLLSVMGVCGVCYHWLPIDKKGGWEPRPQDDYGIENTLKAIAWVNARGDRTFAFNLNIPKIGNNIDLCLFDCDRDGYNDGGIVNDPKAPIMLGELKGGIDPAGADEHWKTANTSLQRIRQAYLGSEPGVFTSFIGAAIEKKMAEEIFDQLQGGTLAYAANLTKKGQVYDYCNWVLGL